VWKDGQTLVSQVFAQRQISRAKRTLFMLASEYGSTSRKDAMIPASYERCDRQSEFRVMGYLQLGNGSRAISERVRFNDYEVSLRFLKIGEREREK